jgi:hypothetical protein
MFRKNSESPCFQSKLFTALETEDKAYVTIFATIEIADKFFMLLLLPPPPSASNHDSLGSSPGQVTLDL